MVDLPDSPAPMYVLENDRDVQEDCYLNTKQEHLDFISLRELVALELVFDFFISDLPLLIFRTHSTTHRGGDL
jgi:hypothetical protein